jgi:phosphoenolpyruvate-protein phosphotransferase
MERLLGAAASPGVAKGPARLIRGAVLPGGGRIDPADAEGEIARLAEACGTAAAALEHLAADIARDHRDEAGIFEAQAAMARDPALRALAEARIGAGQDAVGAVLGAAEDFAGQLEALDDPLLRARAADVRDVAARIAGMLVPSGAGADTLNEAAIVVADDLAPSVTASLPRERMLGICLESGSPTAHAAILARAYGIPAVVGVAGLLDALGRSGDVVELVLDGGTGEVVLAPDAAAMADFATRGRAADAAAAAALDEAELPCVTTDGVDVTLLANVGSPAEAQPARRLGARGVGLYRTEFLFVERPAEPTEDEQVAAYRAVVDAFAPDPVIIRLLDVGGDKPIPYIPLPTEANPFLGVRALRLADQQPDLFVRQLRAALRAAAGAAPGAVKVMAPMVADGVDVELLLRLADQARAELVAQGIDHGQIRVGVMLEIPSAVLVGPSYFSRLDFASLGTNDLTQYTLAADRGNRRLSRMHDALHPAVLRLIRQAVTDGAEAGIEISVCGEMAGDAAAALALVGLGIRRLSMAAVSLAPVRRAIRANSAAGLAAVVEEALALESAAQVRARVAPLVGG